MKLFEIFTKRIPVYWFVLFLLLLVGGMRLMNVSFLMTEKKTVNETRNPPQAASPMHSLTLERYNLIQPLLLTETETEATGLQLTKKLLQDHIQAGISGGALEKVSVYLERLNESDFIAIHPEEYYNPGSLSKIVIMLVNLREADIHPEILQKKLFFAAHNNALGVEEEGTPSLLVPGNNYSVKYLIERMIVDSDNDAMFLLVNNIGFEKINSIYSDLKLEVSHNALELFFNAKCCARLFRVLYNATYLSRQNSEFALSVLAQIKYNGSLTRGLPGSLTIAHKYGIVGHDTTKYLSEAGIIYVKRSPYLMVVMTKGKDFEKMSGMISSLSDIVYSNIMQGRASL